MVLYHAETMTKFLASNHELWSLIHTKEHDSFFDLPIGVQYQTVFNKYIRSDPNVAAEYQRFMAAMSERSKLNTMSSNLDTPLIQEVYQLVKKYGWTNFRAALIEVASRMVTRSYEMGITETGNHWSKIRDKLENTRRSAKLP